jgi:hypothetical protein
MARFEGVLYGATTKERMPVWFSLLLLSQVAALIFVLGIAVTTLLQSGHWRWPWVLEFGCLLATIGMAILFYPLHVALAATRVTNRWAYVAAALVAFSIAYALNVDSILATSEGEPKDRLSEIISSPISSMAYMVPLIAIPVGLLFHAFVWRVHLRQPFSGRDLFLSATLVLVLLEPWLTMLLSDYERKLQITPSDWRYEFVRHIFVIGSYTIPWSGLAAGFARLIDRKIALAVACIGWLMPAALPVGYLVVASRPRLVDFTVGGRTYEFPLRVEPRAEPQGGGQLRWARARAARGPGHRQRAALGEGCAGSALPGFASAGRRAGRDVGRRGFLGRDLCQYAEALHPHLLRPGARRPADHGNQLRDGLLLPLLRA